MTVSGSKSKSVASEFGDHMVGEFQQNLRSSGLTTQQFSCLNTTATFEHTALGKLVQNILVRPPWSTSASHKFKMSDVEVRLPCKSWENIGGEMQWAIDIHI